jgi:hypothetical protein
MILCCGRAVLLKIEVVGDGTPCQLVNGYDISKDCSAFIFRVKDIRVDRGHQGTRPEADAESYKMFLAKLERGNPLRDLSIDVNVILKWIVKKEGMLLWGAFIWLGLGSVGGLF